MKNKLITLLIVFLLLVPLRLPISILFIEFFQWIIAMTTNKAIPNGILATNVILSKMVYNIALSSLFIYNIERLSIEKMHRKANGDPKVYWWTVLIGILLLIFIIVDAIGTNQIFFINK